jgi:hypothetical protein
VLDYSEANKFDEAIFEWEMIDHLIDEKMETLCICERRHIKHLYKFANTKNGNILFPIGSTCIKKFMRGDLAKEFHSVEKEISIFIRDENNYRFQR